MLVDDRQDLPVDHDGLATLAREVLVAEGVADSELSLSFVTSEEIADLHQRYLGEAGPTDVLSFPLDEDDRDEAGVRLLGDVVVAPSVASAANPNDPAAELRLLVVHGILHLLGHDHDDPEERSAMWERQERYAGVRVP
ncbi:MAG TPA: rRNA maturation RNase YbeY [Actinomycetota bacterium]|nr:rRNA maturation RNase YbeY [Actinomycetota bacterium]